MFHVVLPPKAPTLPLVAATVNLPVSEFPANDGLLYFDPPKIQNIFIGISLVNILNFLFNRTIFFDSLIHSLFVYRLSWV